MKIPSISPAARRSGVVLLLVLFLAAAMILILTASVYRTSTVAKLNQRNNDFNTCCMAAEAAVEKVYARMAYDFQSYGVANVTNNWKTFVYQTNIPNATEDAYWSQFQFSDGQGNVGKTYVACTATYFGPLPSAYSTTSGSLIAASNSCIYRIVSNVQLNTSLYPVVGTAQEDVLLALVPLNTWAIFYNGVLEFSDCAAMVVNGRVQANGPIYVGTVASLTFNGGVSSTTNISAPNLDGTTTSDWNPATPSTWNTTFNAGSVQDGTSVTVSMSMTNSHFLIDFPTSSQTGANANNFTNAQMLYNQAQMVLVITNAPTGTNLMVLLTLQASSSTGQVPGSDSSPTTYTYTNASPGFLSTNLPFLSLTNMTYDQRESKTNLFTQINVSNLSTWISAATNSPLQSKGVYPTILYVADRRNATAKQLPSVRLMNAAQLPANNGLGFSVATPNPLYVQGNYNTQTSAGSSTGTNNAYEVPAALMSDALTILSPSWTDSQGYTNYSSSATADDATTMTINAAIVTGTRPSADTSSSTTTFSGGVHNLPRLLEDWTGVNLYLNTSIIRLWDSNMATNQWKYQGTYYNPPNRFFSFDQNFLNPAKVPPGIPNALVPIRFDWGVPPPNTINYSITNN
jgi:hypothetical protein